MTIENLTPYQQMERQNKAMAAYVFQKNGRGKGKTNRQSRISHSMGIGTARKMMQAPPPAEAKTELPEDVQAARIRKAEEKRARRAAKHTPRDD